MNWLDDIYNKAKPDDESLLDPLVPVAPEVPAAPAPINPMVVQSLSDKFSPEARQKLLDQNTADASGPDWRSALAAIGAGFQGKDAMAAGMSVKSAQEKAREQKLKEFDTGRSQDVENMKLGQEQAKFGQDQERFGMEKERFGQEGEKYKRTQELNKRDDEKYLREQDPNSVESKGAQKLFLKMGGPPEVAKDLTAEKWKSLGENYTKMYDIDQKAATAKEERARRNFLEDQARQDKDLLRGEKEKETLASLKTPLGIANTADDAKQLKDAYESKKSFDNKIEEMISLRKKHGGGAILNREDVARGKQLSKDALLEYKNMAKLGILSKSDEDIINKIIPEDPLEFNSPLATMRGEDPILSNLQKFKEDSNKKFATSIATRTRDGLKAGMSPQADSGSVKMKAPDGSVRLVPKDKVKAAMEAGGELLDSPVAGY